MDLFKINEIFWLIKKENFSMKVVGFLRDYHDVCFVTGAEADVQGQKVDNI